MNKAVHKIKERDNAEEILAERERLAALSSDISNALVKVTDIQESLRYCCEAIVKHLDAAFARVWTLNQEDNILELQASAGIYTHIDGEHSRIPLGKFKIGKIAEERKPHLTNKVVGDASVGNQEWAKREGMKAFAGYPLIVEERLIGVIAMFSRQPLPEATIEALSVVADGIALGIEHHQIIAQLREQTEVVETINHIGQMLSAELDQQKLVQAVTDAATELTGAEFGSFFYNVLNEEGASYMLYTLSGVPREAFSNLPMPRATDLFGPTFRGDKTIRLDNVKKDSRYGNNPPYKGMPKGHLPVTSY
ncbi:MAG TPA: GAF domain-containing protein, partial [Pyrinomonadaceae bacterium]|nr:GAF domain-containing protein [Pyrinomonadaceae bacterium]